MCFLIVFIIFSVITTAFLMVLHKNKFVLILFFVFLLLLLYFNTIVFVCFYIFLECFYIFLCSNRT